MTTFARPDGPPPVAPLDPTKHVKYTLGMVLGVDDFDQEFAYLVRRATAGSPATSAATARCGGSRSPSRAARSPGRASTWRRARR